MKDCNQCGKCCIRYGGGDLSASASDIERWETHRPDIARYVNDGKIWISPETGRQLTRCPWLQQLAGQSRYVCGIYEDRPEDCRYYPVRIDEMVRDECEMLERKDLINPRQAQKTLDYLMADTRTPKV